MSVENRNWNQCNRRANETTLPCPVKSFVIDGVESKKSKQLEKAAKTRSQTPGSGEGLLPNCRSMQIAPAIIPLGQALPPMPSCSTVGAGNWLVPRELARLQTLHFRLYPSFAPCSKKAKCTKIRRSRRCPAKNSAEGHFTAFRGLWHTESVKAVGDPVLAHRLLLGVQVKTTVILARSFGPRMSFADE